MNAKTILIAAVVTLGTLSFPETADARPKYRKRHYRAHPHHYQYRHHHYPRYYYHSRPYYNYGPRYYYYDPYRYRRGTSYYLQYGPLTIHGRR